ncbi:adenylate/guanylate cyclase domain-containing protein [Ensifer adhaerens]|uniref:adenylate/guanylate cyclase domain-containing protein n=1 Tax=Ensifer adhaerens TaxID=106592 RepID=UPI001F30204F|nr:adenylate/guanylate cyclase domain-containing protein [Ensifer adhaerens]
MFIDTLHPVLESQGFYWHANKTDEVEQQVFSRRESEDNAKRWRSSPFHFMSDNGLSELRIALDCQGEARFSILDDLKQEGHSDYLALIHQLSDKDAIGEMDSIYSRWSTRRPGGFAASDLEALRKLVPVLALGVKSATLRKIANSLVEVYLGSDPGRRVLEGRIARGTVESIHTVLWYSDMENYTSLSEAVDSSKLIAMLNDYSEAVISAVYGAGGDVLKLIGDGTLAIFNHVDQNLAAAAALRARDDLQRRLSELNERRREDGQAITSAYVALHVGEVFYGNVGSDQRLDFTVIGPAVNEVCRISSTCRAVGHSFVVSQEFAALLSEPDRAHFADLGPFQLKGVTNAKRLYARKPS